MKDIRSEERRVGKVTVDFKERKYVIIPPRAQNESVGLNHINKGFEFKYSDYPSDTMLLQTCIL